MMIELQLSLYIQSYYYYLIIYSPILLLGVSVYF